MQHSIFLASKQSNFRLIRYKQRLLTNSLYGRLIIIREVFDNDFLKNSNMVSIDILSEVLLILDHKNPLYGFYDFYSIKNGGFSFLSKFFNFYKFYFDFLLNLSFLPFIETNLDKSLFASRPFKSYCDVPIELKKLMIKKNNKCGFSLNLSTEMNSIGEAWLSKNLPIEFTGIKLSYNTYNLMRSFDLNLSYCSFFNFMLNGMVWINN
jgi:hypothetical protein